MAAGEVSDKKTFWREERALGTSGTHKINSGTIEWPFEYILDPSMPESIEGMNSTYIVYYLHASVSRPGWNAKDITTTQHIRIVRTLGAEQMETTRSRVCISTSSIATSMLTRFPTDQRRHLGKQAQLQHLDPYRCRCFWNLDCCRRRTVAHSKGYQTRQDRDEAHRSSDQANTVVRSTRPAR